MTVTPVLSRTRPAAEAVDPAPPAAGTASGPAGSGSPLPRRSPVPAPARRTWRGRLREAAALRRADRAWARAAAQAPTPSARAELRTLRGYGRA